MREFLLADLLELTKDGEWGEHGPSPDLEPMLVIRGTDFADVRYSSVSSVPLRYIPRTIAERKALQPEDILIETAGGTKDQPTGRTVFLKKDLFRLSENRFACASFSRFLRVKRGLIRPDYLFWFLQNLYQTGEMYPFHVQHTGVARFQYTQFAKSQKVPVPDLTEQGDIATLLNSLDDKIELNRRMNETLEAIARVIFKDWFVDFGPTRAKVEGRLPYLAPGIWAFFPDRLDEERKPKGWKVAVLETVLQELETGGRPKGGVSAYTSGIPSVGAESIVGLGTFDYAKTKYVPREFFEAMTKGRVKSRDVLLYKDGGRPGAFEPHLTLVGDGFPFDTFAINEHVYRLRAKGSFGQALLYFWLSSDLVMEEMRIKGTGVAIPGLNSTQVKSLTTLLPTPEVANAFDAHVEPMIAKVLSNCCEARSLAKMRDILLPKLMSGEIRVRDAEKRLEAIV
jgi:type I restriction enzyme, S subunit